MIRKGSLHLLAVLSLALGLIGIAVPLLPTVPFLLLASACAMRSSPRLADWIHRHPRLGPPVLDWQRNGVIRPLAKITACAAIAASMLVIELTVSLLPAKLLAWAVLGIALTFILSRPSRAPIQRFHAHRSRL